LHLRPRSTLHIRPPTSSIRSHPLLPPTHTLTSSQAATCPRSHTTLRLLKPRPHHTILSPVPQ
jgi:hypothetical protein